MDIPMGVRIGELLLRIRILPRRAAVGQVFSWNAEAGGLATTGWWLQGAADPLTLGLIFARQLNYTFLQSANLATLVDGLFVLFLHCLSILIDDLVLLSDLNFKLFDAVFEWVSLVFRVFQLLLDFFEYTFGQFRLRGQIKLIWFLARHATTVLPDILLFDDGFLTFCDDLIDTAGRNDRSAVISALFTDPILVENH